MIGLADNDSKEDGGDDSSEVLESICGVEKLNPSSFSFCAHGRVSLDEVCRGEVKSVCKEGTEELLMRYSLQIISSDGSLATFKTGKDICNECAAVKEADLEFADLLEKKNCQRKNCQAAASREK